MMQALIMPRFVLQLLELLPVSRKKTGLEKGSVKELAMITESSKPKRRRNQYATPGSGLGHIPPEQLEHIIHQIETEDYHVEYLASFAWKKASPVEVIAAVILWAESSGLKVSINHERGICFFEKR